MNWFSRILPGSHATPQSETTAAFVAEWDQLPDADLGSSHFETRYVLVDVQADGPDPQRNTPVALGAVVVQGESIRMDQLYYCPLEPDPVQAVVGLLACCGKSPLVTFNQPFNQTLFNRVVSTYVGDLPDLTWLDLGVLLPSLFRERSDIQRPFSWWLESFGLQHPQPHHALHDAYLNACLLQTLLARANQDGLYTPNHLLDTQKSRRWLKG